MAVGNGHYTRVFGATQTALALASYRAMAVRCVLDFGNPDVKTYVHYNQLEASEKVNLSYWIGMTLTAFAARELLGVTKTTHALHLGKPIQRANANSKSLADLVGYAPKSGSTPPKYHVLEAKGRQSNPTMQDRKDWKQQARTIRSINGRRVSTCSYCVGLIKPTVKIRLVDPPNEENGTNIEMDAEAFGAQYYEPFIDYLNGQSFQVRIRGGVFRLRPIVFDPVSSDWIFVGLEETIASRRANANETLINWSSEYAGEEENWYVGEDGVLVAAGPNPSEPPDLTVRSAGY